MAGLLYLHGFASSPRSRKGTYLAQRFAEIGAPFEQPDLNGGDFRGLTLTRQLRQIDAAARRLRPDLLIGSSLGGYLAALYAAEQPRLAPALGLLAPAFDFGRRFAARLGAQQLERWRERGEIEAFHYGEAALRPLGY